MKRKSNNFVSHSMKYEVLTSHIKLINEIPQDLRLSQSVFYIY